MYIFEKNILHSCIEWLDNESVNKQVDRHTQVSVLPQPPHAGDNK